MDLGLDLGRIDRPANVLYGREPRELEGASVGVCLNTGDLHRELRGRAPHRRPTGGLDRLVPAPELRAHRDQLFYLDESVRDAANPHAPVDDLQGFRAAFQYPGPDLAKL